MRYGCVKHDQLWLLGDEATVTQERLFCRCLASPSPPPSEQVSRRERGHVGYDAAAQVHTALENPSDEEERTWYVHVS